VSDGGTTREKALAELGRLFDLTARLREECPWDRKQTQESIIQYTLEETYELADAIRERPVRGDGAVRGELGDLLFQVYFLARVAEEQELYDLGDVARGIHDKLVRRHPHIFGDATAETPEEVRATWEAIKKNSEGREGIFHDIPGSFPSTLLAQKLQQRAADVGFDWQQAHDVLAKIKEETAEVEEEMAQGSSKDELLLEVGDLLFAVVNLGRKLKIDPELALRRSALRFRARVEKAAEIAQGEGLGFRGLGLDEQETYYQRAKKEQGR
jgi:nucleoside triphosphate diphosphatase